MTTKPGGGGLNALVDCPLKKTFTERQPKSLSKAYPTEKYAGLTDMSSYYIFYTSDQSFLKKKKIEKESDKLKRNRERGRGIE